MKLKYSAYLLIIPLLASCNGGGGGKGKKSSSEISFDFDPPTIDVEQINVSSLTKDVLTGEIANDSDNYYFDFYEVSDFHGAVNYSVDDKTIGIAKMGDYFSKKRADNPGGTVVLSSGDMFQGSAESNLTRGYYVNYAMNVMGFEAMALGNHEFDWGVEWLRKNNSVQINNYSIPYLGANVFMKGTNNILDFCKSSIIIERNDFKIGVVGTLGDNAEKSIMPSLIENLEFKKELPIVQAEATRLKAEEGCDIVVWLSHRDAKELSSCGVSKADGVDLVFGGHSHTNTSTETGGIPFLQTKNYGKGIAHARLAINKSTKDVTSISYEVDDAPYTYSGLVDHPEVKKVCGAYNTVIDPIKNQVIGKTDAKLEVSGSTFSLTNLCVDTMSLVAKKWAKDHNDRKFVAAFHNANGGVRADMDAGSITFGSVYRSFPFDNEVCIAVATGKKLKAYFDKAGSYGVWHDPSIKAYSDLNDSEEYYFTTTDFMGTSENFVFKLKDEDLIRTGYIVRDSIAGRISNQKDIEAANFDRTENAQFRVPSR